MVKLEGSGIIGIASVAGAGVTFLTLLGSGFRRRP
jgi:hypothetical protein